MQSAELTIINIYVSSNIPSKYIKQKKKKKVYSLTGGWNSLHNCQLDKFGWKYCSVLGYLC